MKYIITEQQLKNTIKKFNKENIERDKLSNIMEELVLRFFENSSPVCDVVAVKVLPTPEYVVLVLTPNYIGNSIENRIAKYIEDYIGIRPMVLLNQSQDCMEEDTIE
jgi:hypothetical protein